MAYFIPTFQNLSVLSAAQYQYGPTASLHPITGANHAYDWAAKTPNTGNTRLSIDLHKYVRDKLGSNLRVVQKGFGAYDWGVFDPYAWDYAIQPIVLVASDLIWQQTPIANACANYKHNVGAVADWYQDQVGKKMQLLEPHVFASSRTVAQWQQIYNDQANRWDLFDACYAEIRTAYANRLNANITYVVTQFCGDLPMADFDAAGGMMQAGQGQLAAISAFACCHKYTPNTTTPWDDTVMYAIGHELGHCLGLPHPESTEAGYAETVMQWGKPVNATLLQREKQKLYQSPYFVNLR